jgi:hypothetical protein
LDQYGRHGKVQQHFILPQASKQHQFFLDAAAKLPKLLPTPEQKVAWLVTEGDSGAGLTLHHHSLDPYGRHGKVQQHCILWHAQSFKKVMPTFIVNLYLEVFSPTLTLSTLFLKRISNSNFSNLCLT